VESKSEISKTGVYRDNFMNENNKNILSNIIFIPYAILMLCACSVTTQNHPNLTVTLEPSSTYTTIHVTPPPSGTFTPTTSSTQTTTPVATLISHEWVPRDPLISFGDTVGDGGFPFDDSLPLEFTLLSNGELFIINWNEDPTSYEIKSRTLSVQNICILLNSIDQTGFFDYDPSTYIKYPRTSHLPVMGAGYTKIAVQAWRVNSVSLYNLGGFINEMDKIKEISNCNGCSFWNYPTILPSIRKTYQLLANYVYEDLKIYNSDRIGLWVEEDPFTDTNGSIPWPIKSVNLANLISPAEDWDDDPKIILTGSIAKTVYKLFNQKINISGINVTEGDKVYWVFARPLLPNEYLSEDKFASTAISCSPSDGWINMP
jgi:hypothetical protein